MPRAERLAVLGLLAAMVASAVTLFVLSDDLAFWSDELDWLTFGDDFAPETLLTPHNSHLIALVRVIYEGFPELFGADYVPFRILNIAAVLACAGLFFVLARRRVGGPLALAPTLVLLFFGSSAEVVVSPLGLPISLSVAFGLATFVALERESRGWDVAALVFLALSVLSDTFGAIIAGGVLLYLLLDPERRSRLWVAAVPILGYVAWWIWARKFEQDIAAADNLAGVPAFVLESAAATLGALTGIGKSFGVDSDSLETIVQAVFIALALAGTALLVVRARRVGATAALWAFGLTLLAFWVAVGLSESDVRTPDTPRYLLFAVIMALLVFAEAYRRERISPRARTILLIFFLACLAGNVARLVYNADGLSDRAAAVQADLAMIELAGANANPGFQPQVEGPPASPDIVAPAAEVNGFAAEHGSLGFTLEEVRALEPKERRDADFVLLRALNAEAVPVDQAILDAASDCREVEGEFELDPGVSSFEPDGEEGATLTIGRFGGRPSVAGGELAPGTVAIINLAADDAPEAWLAKTDAPVEVCSLPFE
jgi:hypothetical protein